MTIRCADIPKLPGLESIRFRAGLQGASRIVRWPYIAENESISPWIKGGELVFVTGINLLRSESSLCALLHECMDHQVAGLVILTGDEYIKTIPKSLLNIANELNFPVFEQPYALKMVTVTEVISNAIVQDNLIGQSIHMFLTRLMHGYADAPELIHLRSQELGLSQLSCFSAIALSASVCQEDEATLSRLQQQHVLEQMISDLLQRRDNPWPVLVCESDFILLWPCENAGAERLDDAEQILVRLKHSLPHSRIFMGLSSTHSELTQFGVAVEQARQALRFAQQHPERAIFLHEQLGVCRLFAAIPQRHLLADFCQENLRELCFARDPNAQKLKATLSAFLNHAGHLQETAEALGIHRNTLNNRLKQIERLTHCSLADAFQRLNLQNALLIEQMLFQNHTITD